MIPTNEPVQCRDGFRMSVQASGFHYCTPRIDNADAYTACEVGFPSQAEPLLMEWIEVPGGDPTRGVYVAVPSHIIAQVIAKHGGKVSGEVPKGVMGATPDQYARGIIAQKERVAKEVADKEARLEKARSERQRQASTLLKDDEALESIKSVMKSAGTFTKAKWAKMMDKLNQEAGV